MTRDWRLLFGLRAVRLFAYGLIAVILVLQLSALGFDATRIGRLIALTYLGDAVISLWLTTRADRWGRRRTLRWGAALMIAGGVAFALSGNFWVLAAAATVGVISPSGNEVGPFLAVEQACLAEIVAPEQRTRLFAWYHVAGFTSGALGAGLAGIAVQNLERRGWSALAAYRLLCAAYAVCGVGLVAGIARLQSAVESPHAAGGGRLPWSGLAQSRPVVTRLSALFALDSFAGGFVVQSFAAYWFFRKFHLPLATIGGIFFGTNLLSGFSALAAAPLARRIGLVNTMVFTHLPSNVLLLLVPLMPTAGGAIAVLLARNAISQMDVPTRLSYVNAVVPPAERSAANGITGTARQVGLVLAPLAVGRLFRNFAYANWIFWIGGGLKIVYDLILWRTFRSVRPPEEIRP